MCPDSSHKTPRPIAASLMPWQLKTDVAAKGLFLQSAHYFALLFFSTLFCCALPTSTLVTNQLLFRFTTGKRSMDSTSTGERIVQWLIQVIGVSAALIFGPFSIVSWQNSEMAKAQANTSNAIALLAHCSSIQSNDVRATPSLLLSKRGNKERIHHVF